jgi:hypothetical protein
MMPGDAGFIEQVLEQRERDRQALSEALGQERGPEPYSHLSNEDDQDRMWQQAHPDYTDPPDVTDHFRQRFEGYRQVGLPVEQAAAEAAKETTQVYPTSKYMRLLVPQADGGAGLTPLAASYEKYPYRRFLVEGAGPSIEDQIKYAQRRAQRTGQSPPPPPPQPEVSGPLAGPPLAGPPSLGAPPSEGPPMRGY